MLGPNHRSWCRYLCAKISLSLQPWDFWLALLSSPSAWYWDLRGPEVWHMAVGSLLLPPPSTLPHQCRHSDSGEMSGSAATPLLTCEIAFSLHSPRLALLSSHKISASVPSLHYSGFSRSLHVFLFSLSPGFFWQIFKDLRENAGIYRHHQVIKIPLSFYTRNRIISGHNFLLEYFPFGVFF